MKLIDADEMKRNFQDELCSGIFCAECSMQEDGFCRAERWMDIQPTIAAEPRKHGRWIWNKRLGNWYCSNCDRIMNPYTVEKSEGLYEMCQPPFCGWCGARMDEAEE